MAGILFDTELSLQDPPEREQTSFEQLEQRTRGELAAASLRPANEAKHERMSTTVDPKLKTKHTKQDALLEPLTATAQADGSLQPSEDAPRISRSQMWVDDDGNPIESLNDEEDRRWRKHEQALQQERNDALQPSPSSMMDPMERSYRLWKHTSPEVGLGSLPQSTASEHFSWDAKMETAKSANSWKNHLQKTDFKTFQNAKASEPARR